MNPWPTWNPLRAQFSDENNGQRRGGSYEPAQPNNSGSIAVFALLAKSTGTPPLTVHSARLTQYQIPAPPLHLNFTASNPPFELLHSFRAQPPPAPRLRNVPLPDTVATHWQGPSFPPQPQVDVLPIDLTGDVDFDVVARILPSHSIPPHTAIHVQSTSRECTFLHFVTQDRPQTAVAVIRRLQALLHAPLSLPHYHAYPAKRAVHRHFLSRSGHEGVGLWRGFLNGARHPRGPKGADFLRGHSCMWGFSQDYTGGWVINVDVPLPPGA
ncbi:hypothetical protein GGX14DRAFT_406074 [Mycena pura]|uniref:Uncharacterized protein n=1 Tax=Mycena pura TaxID=153505 RepID=A0AAD6XYH2_9AGAR|nr:hypothetical protein GGX14DRAFT_406074 [Mycena pura]